MQQLSRKKTFGWIALGLSTAITCIWAFWGIIENFHEGWFYRSLLSNLGLMVLQYLSPMLVFMGVTLLSIYRKPAGVAMHVLLGLAAIWFFKAISNAATFFIILPLFGIGALYWYGILPARATAVKLAVGLPLVVLVTFGVAPAWRVSQRVDDGNLQARLVQGNGVALVWAPDGPGWPRQGKNWEDSRQVCRYLNQDGKTLAAVPQDVWRLPTVDEAVRSMARHGQNSGGVWQPDTAEVTYEITPDKESPLWNIYSQVIYWWTATEINEERVYMIAYNGKVWPREKEFGPAYLGFRCVK